MRDLVTFYRDRLHLFSETDNWCLALKNFFLEKPVDEALITSLLDECRDPTIQNPHDYIFYLKKLVSVGWMLRFQPMPALLSDLQNSLQTIYTQGFWKEFQLGEALYSLGCHLAQLPSPSLEPKLLAKGGILIESGHHLSDGGIPHPMLNAELALIWLFLGWETENETLIESALKWVHAAIGLFDHENRPFHGIWLRESEYDPLTFFSLYFLLFSAATEMLISSKVRHLADALFDALKEVDDRACGQPPYFVALLARGFEVLSEAKKTPEVEGKFSINEVNESLGYLTTRQKDMSIACSFSGVNTGLGALHKTHVRIVSFGPHFTPLADSDRYGLHRTSSGASEPFRDLEFDQKEETFQVKGWARLISPFSSHVSPHNVTLTEPGKQWIFFSATGDGEKVTFESRLSEHDESHPLYFAYFIAADQVSIEGGESLKPATLNRYQGPSRLLTFEKGEEKLTLAPQSESEMHVIPLAGSHHFWAADFLIAFAFEDHKQSYAWDIS